MLPHRRMDISLPVNHITDLLGLKAITNQPILLNLTSKVILLKVTNKATLLKDIMHKTPIVDIARQMEFARDSLPPLHFAAALIFASGSFEMKSKHFIPTIMAVSDFFLFTGFEMLVHTTGFIFGQGLAMVNWRFFYLITFILITRLQLFVRLAVKALGMVN